jgi:hypothetical protein
MKPSKERGRGLGRGVNGLEKRGEPIARKGLITLGELALVDVSQWNREASGAQKLWEMSGPELSGASGPTSEMGDSGLEAGASQRASASSFTRSERIVLAVERPQNWTRGPTRARRRMCVSRISVSVASEWW